MLDRWNAHDIEGYMEAYWKSPELSVVVDSEQFDGWQQLHDSYVNGYPNRIAMGFIQPKRIQVKLRQRPDDRCSPPSRDRICSLTLLSLDAEGGHICAWAESIA